jgi:lipoprotein-anchoring transpeptidase ErfK/SrfK
MTGVDARVVGRMLLHWVPALALVLVLTPLTVAAATPTSAAAIETPPPLGPPAMIEPITAPKVTLPPIPTPVLLPGARGPAVASLWQMLYTLHYIDTPTQAPARYGTALELGVRRFEWLNGLPVEPVVDPALWNSLSAAVAEHKAISPEAAQWLIVVSEGHPETASVYFQGKLVLSTPANTGISQDPTPTGVYFVYEKLAYQVMKGKNPNGMKYADPVHDIWYFLGGDAFHGFVRATYGWPQSLGCVEVPPSVAASLFPRIPIGVEVDVVS